MERFVEMFGEAQKYINTTSYLARGHLAPDADFIFSSSQFATYFYVNVAPQFQAINGGNWVRVETMARKLADHYQTDLIIHTGLYDILKLQNHKIYLEEDNLIEVPKWYWKVIINPVTKAGIVMITSNNPFAPLATLRSEEFCQNVCEEAGVETKPLQNVRKGYTFCCEVNEFKRMVNVLPNSLNVPNLLQCGEVVQG
jgi:DNA/RNA endonuclease G (NUC1)